MPFLTLRHSKDTNTCSTSDEAGDNPWPEVTTLDIECVLHKTLCKCMVREANVSVVVCGWDERKWVCWAFSNTHSNPTSRNEEEPDDDDMHEDHIATDGNGPENGITVDVNNPIWDARAYWLRIVDLRMRIIHKEWKWLVMNTEARVEAWVSTHNLRTNGH